MSRRRGLKFYGYIVGQTWIQGVYLRPVQAARQERVAQQIRRVKRRAARRWSA